MKKLLLLLLFPILSFSQDSYIVVEVQHDSNAVQDVSRVIIAAPGLVILNQAALVPNEYYSDTLWSIVDSVGASGIRSVVLMDGNGDGWYDGVTMGYFRVSNACQGVLAEFISDSTNPFTSQSLSFTILPCTIQTPPPPPIESYDCYVDTCIDPLDGSGLYATVLDCQYSGCVPPPPPPVSIDEIVPGVSDDIIYDIYGRKITNMKKNTIYIINKKKFIRFKK